MPVSITLPIATHQANASTQVDTLAGQIRLKYITSIPGQDATYLSKLTDAQAYKTAGYPAIATPPTSYLWVYAEYTVMLETNSSATTQQAADFIISTAASWDQIGSQIEGARRLAKNTIAAATTVSQIRAAVAEFQAVMAQF